MSDPPLITVGIPVFNGGRWLRETVDSIFSQTVDDLELIICDNASTDNTEEISRSYAANDQRVRYFRNPVNLGAPSNYNLCVEHARGKYFKWNSASDLCLPTLLERCIEVLEDNPDVVLCYGGTQLLNDDGAYVDVVEDLKLGSDHASERFIQLCENIGLNHIMNGVLRTEQLRTTALNSQFLGSDLCLMAEIALLGKVVQLPEYLFVRRNIAETASSLLKGEALQRYVDPELKIKLPLPGLKQLYGFYRAARRVPMKKSERRKVYMYLLRRTRWTRYKVLDELYIAFKKLIGQA